MTLTAETQYPMPQVDDQIVYLKHFITRETIEVGDYTYYHDVNGASRFEQENVLYHESFLGDKLIIGKFCQIAMKTKFMMNACHHDMSGFTTYPFGAFNPEWDPQYFDYIINKGDTVVGHDVWFGYDCTITPGITIGNGAVIATGSIVTKDVEPYTIVGGNPAKVIRKRYDDATIARLEQLCWWDWPMEKIVANMAALQSGDVTQLEALVDV